MGNRLDRIALIFAGFFPLFATWIYYYALADPTQVQILYSSCKVVQFSFPFIWIYGVRRKSLRQGLQFTLPRAKDFFYGGLSGLVMGALVLGSYFFFFKHQSWIETTPGRLQDKLNTLGFGTLDKFVLLASFISLFHSFLEEYYWRWFLFREIGNVMSRKSAILLSSLAFTLHHVLIVHAYVPLSILWSGTILFSIPVFLAGCIWAAQYARNWSLSEVWISHVLVDAALMWMALDLVWGKSLAHSFR